MVIKRLFGSPLHEHPEPEQRVQGVAELPPDSPVLAGLLAGDPAAEVRAAAARRCTNLEALAAAWRAESHATVRDALASALASRVSRPTRDAATPPSTRFATKAH